MKRLISIILIIAAIMGHSCALKMYSVDSSNIPPIIDSGYADEIQDDGNLFGLPFFTSVDLALDFYQYIEDPEYWPDFQCVCGDIEALGRTARLTFEFPIESKHEIVTEIRFETPIAEASILYEEVFDLCVNKWGQPDSGQAWLINNEEMIVEPIDEKTGESVSVEQVVKGEVENIYYEYIWRTDEQHRYEMMIWQMERGIQTIFIEMSLGF